MCTARQSITWTLLYYCLLLLTACNSTPLQQNLTAKTTATVKVATPTPLAPTATVTPVPPPPQHYHAKVILRSGARPDDLAFDTQGRILFSDPHNNIVARVNADGSFTTLLAGRIPRKGRWFLPKATRVLANQE